MITIKRTHEICMGHRVYGHENKCANLHGHNYIFEFIVAAKTGLDSVGRVIDFSEVKYVLCRWLEDNWDHKTILWKEDPLFEAMQRSNYFTELEIGGIVGIPVNPTAENIAIHFLNIVAPQLTIDLSWYLLEVIIHETGKCSARVSLTKEQKEIVSEVKKKVTMPRDHYCSRQCGLRRDCLCDGLSDKDKIDCCYCTSDLPF